MRKRIKVTEGFRHTKKDSRRKRFFPSKRNMKKIEDLTHNDIGKTFQVSADDCCVTIEFTSTLKEIVFEEGKADEAIFENGVKMGRSWGATELTKI